MRKRAIYVQSIENSRTSKLPPFEINIEATLGLSSDGNDVVLHYDTSSVVYLENGGHFYNPFKHVNSVFEAEGATICISKISVINLRNPLRLPLDLRIKDLFAVRHKLTNYSMLTGPNEEAGHPIAGGKLSMDDGTEPRHEKQRNVERDGYIVLHIPAGCKGGLESERVIYESVVTPDYQLIFGGMEGGYRIQAEPVVHCDIRGQPEKKSAWRQLMGGWASDDKQGTGYYLYEPTDPIYHATRLLCMVCPDNNHLEAEYVLVSGEPRLRVPAITDAWVRSFMADTIFRNIRYTDFSLTGIEHAGITPELQARFNELYLGKLRDQGVRGYVPVVSAVLRVEAIRVDPGMPVMWQRGNPLEPFVAEDET